MLRWRPSGELTKVRPHLALFHTDNNSNEPSATTTDRSDLCIHPLRSDLSSHHLQKNCLGCWCIDYTCKSFAGAFLQGHLWSVWVLGQFSHTGIQRSAATFSKGIFFERMFGTKGQILQVSGGTFCLCTVWQWQCCHTITHISPAPKPSAPSTWQRAATFSITKVWKKSTFYLKITATLLCWPRGGGENQLVLLTGSWEKGVYKISEAASKWPWQIHNL